MTRDERGSAMVMVLVAVVFMALVSTAFLGKSGAAFSAGATLQTQVDLQYGADAGLEKGVRALRDDFAASPRTKCLTPLDDDPTTLATFPWSASGFGVTTTCRTLQGYAASGGSSLYGAAIVTTGGDVTLTTQSGTSNPLDVRGSVYVASTVDTGEIKKPIAIQSGDLAVRGCSGTPTAAGITTGAPYRRYCTSLAPRDVASTYALPASVPPAAPAPISVTSKCRIFLPGTYTSVPALLNANNSTNYFASGVYYFRDIGSWGIDNKMQVVAGAPQGGYSGIGTGELAPCGGGDAYALSQRPGAAVNGTGATFVLGGTSRISIKEALVMNQRPETATHPIPTSVYVVRSTDPSAWAPWTGGAARALTDDSATARMEFNGAINAYDADVAVFASNPTTAVARAGIVARSLDLKASASAGALDITGYGSSATAGTRIVRIVATAEGVSGDAGSSEGVAVVEFFNDGSAPHVISWRID